MGGRLRFPSDERWSAGDHLEAAEPPERRPIIQHLGKLHLREVITDGD
jgi:hypothetical protein